MVDGHEHCSLLISVPLRLTGPLAGGMASVVAVEGEGWRQTFERGSCVGLMEAGHVRSKGLQMDSVVDQSS